MSDAPREADGPAAAPAANAGVWTDQRMRLAMARILQTGTLISVALIAAGLLVVAIHGDERLALSRRGGSFNGLFREPGVALISAGLICLIATPVSRELLALGIFTRLRERALVLCTTLVLALIAASLVIGVR